MIGQLLICAVRTSLGVEILSFAFDKVMLGTAVANQMWRPSWLGRRSMMATVIVISWIEVLFAIFGIAGAIVDPRVAVVTSMVLFLTVTCYGIKSRQLTGTCGCSGARYRRNTPSSITQLIVRNTCIFFGFGAAVVFGPSTDLLVRHEELAMLLGAIPFIHYAAQGAGRFYIQAGKQS